MNWVAKFIQKWNLTYIHNHRHWNVSNELIIDIVRKGDDEEIKSNSDHENAGTDLSIEKPTTTVVRNLVETLMTLNLLSASNKMQPSNFEIDSERLNNLKQVLIINFL